MHSPFNISEYFGKWWCGQLLVYCFWNLWPLDSTFFVRSSVKPCTLVSAGVALLCCPRTLTACSSSYCTRLSFTISRFLFSFPPSILLSQPVIMSVSSLHSVSSWKFSAVGTIVSYHELSASFFLSASAKVSWTDYFLPGCATNQWLHRYCSQMYRAMQIRSVANICFKLNKIFYSALWAFSSKTHDTSPPPGSQKEALLLKQNPCSIFSVMPSCLPRAKAF